jgi:hypothetical protein
VNDERAALELSNIIGTQFGLLRHLVELNMLESAVYGTSA